MINNSGARAIVVESGYLPLLAEVAQRLDRLEYVIVRGDAGDVALPPRLKVTAWNELPGARAQPAALQPWDPGRARQSGPAAARHGRR